MVIESKSSVSNIVNEVCILDIAGIAIGACSRRIEKAGQRRLKWIEASIVSDLPAPDTTGAV